MLNSEIEEQIRIIKNLIRDLEEKIRIIQIKLDAFIRNEGNSQ